MWFALTVGAVASRWLYMQIFLCVNDLSIYKAQDPLDICSPIFSVSGRILRTLRIWLVHCHNISWWKSWIHIELSLLPPFYSSKGSFENTASDCVLFVGEDSELLFWVFWVRWNVERALLLSSQKVTVSRSHSSRWKANVVPWPQPNPVWPSVWFLWCCIELSNQQTAARAPPGICTLCSCLRHPPTSLTPDPFLTWFLLVISTQ